MCKQIVGIARHRRLWMAWHLHRVLLFNFELRIVSGILCVL